MNRRYCKYNYVLSFYRLFQIRSKKNLIRNLYSRKLTYMFSSLTQRTHFFFLI